MGMIERREKDIPFVACETLSVGGKPFRRVVSRQKEKENVLPGLVALIRAEQSQTFLSRAAPTFFNGGANRKHSVNFVRVASHFGLTFLPVLTGLRKISRLNIT